MAKATSKPKPRKKSKGPPRRGGRDGKVSKPKGEEPKKRGGAVRAGHGKGARSVEPRSRGGSKKAVVARRGGGGRSTKSVSPRKRKPVQVPQRKKVAKKKVPPKKKLAPKKLVPKRPAPKKRPLPKKLIAVKKPQRDSKGRFKKKVVPRKRPTPPLPKKRKPVKAPPPKKRRKKVPPPPLPPPPPKKRKKRPANPPTITEGSSVAEGVIMSKLVDMENLIHSLFPDLDLSIKTFINSDGTVDGEIRIANLPDDWRSSTEGLVLLNEFLVNVMSEVGPITEEGSYWVAFGVRFGPSTEAEAGDLAEIYKRFRGLFQAATHTTPADSLPSIKTNITNGLVVIVRALMERRGLPPAVVFIRFTYSPNAHRPQRYEGERPVKQLKD